MFTGRSDRDEPREAPPVPARAVGVQPDTVFWPDDHRPPLGHEYQLDLDAPDGWAFHERLRSYLRERVG